MWLLLLSTAWAGPPYHACDTWDSTLGFVDPKSSTVYLLDGDRPKKLAEVPHSGEGWNHVLLAKPGGGWWSDVSPVQEITAEGEVSPASSPTPVPFWDALKGKGTADARGTTALLVTRDDRGGVVFRNEEGASQVKLWEFEGWAEAPLVLHEAGDTIYAVGHGAIDTRSTTGEKTGELPLPDHDTVGLCGGTDEVPLTAITLGSRQQACVRQWSGTAWTEVACISPL